MSSRLLTRPTVGCIVIFLPNARAKPPPWVGDDCIARILRRYDERVLAAVARKEPLSTTQQVSKAPASGVLGYCCKGMVSLKKISLSRANEMWRSPWASNGNRQADPAGANGYRRCDQAVPTVFPGILEPGLHFSFWVLILRPENNLKIDSMTNHLGAKTPDGGLTAGI